MFDTGTTGFMLVATSLVMLMTPGLAFFYGGLACKRNILGIMMQSFVSLGITTILWFIVGYSLCFSGGAGGIIGNLDKMFLNGVTITSAFSANGAIPEIVFISYQMMFAIITPALITGAFVNRVTFKAYLIFLVLWQVLVYYPFVHMVWGGGLLANIGVLDYAGGIVVHATAGFAALASVFYVGSRKDRASKPNSLPLVAIGTALLWFGWYGFNAGSELNVDTITPLAFLNTDISASFAAITWLTIAWVKQGKPKFVELLTGSVAGLATITPAAGYVSMPVAALFGIAAGFVCYYCVHIKNKLGWDDALDVWGVHGMGGVLGTVLLGIFASTAINPNGADGLLYGGGSFFMIQLIVVVAASLYAFVFTYIMLIAINYITPVKVSDDEEHQGLDMSIHGEMAYDIHLI
ncbi:ammonium transporter [Methanolobus vulcani]|jgi:Amt family ammonium transporter|uniref:Ammonium transporter n=2 Tax=Methanolobus vulcani TaxID=38026 RepID=A0A7Z7AYZ2_9EURY|nr:ammonium transporter, Amt family [Methanolobus sp.]MDK2948712.1 ammonium transporter, Amt family [Methanolobus sp.]SDF71368.1 ammonium transporter [Methanolobus vulcani]